MEGFCGGYEVTSVSFLDNLHSFLTVSVLQRQWIVNKGKCGLCGDAFDEPIKPHEAPGGIFATGTIVRNYMEGQIIPIKIEITAVHKGYYEFKICPNNNVKQDPNQECFERLKSQDFSKKIFNSYRFYSLDSLSLSSMIKAHLLVN